MDRKVMLNRIKKIIKGFLNAWILIAAGILAAGLVTLLTSAGLKTGSYIIIGSISAGGFICGLSASSAAGRRGLLVGAAAGMILSLSVLAAYLLYFGPAVENSLNILPLTLPVGTGAAGGIFGISAARNPGNFQK